MNFSNKLQAFLLVGGVVFLAAGALPVFAQETTDVTLEVQAGALTITAPTADLALSALQISDTVETSTGTSGNITIQDTSGAFAGWNADVKFSNLQGLTDNTKHVLLASDAAGDFDLDTETYLTVTPSTCTVVSGNTSVNSNASAADITSLSALNGTGESNTFGICSASTGNGAGTYTVTVGVSLDIPAFGTYPGGEVVTPQNYQGLLTASVS